MKSPAPDAPKRTQINILLEADALDRAQRTAKERGLNLSSLIRTLLADEARRLGIS